VTHMAQDGRRWPKISIVTPSYNQGRFLEEAICSVLDQGYPNLEYIIIDGGSTDESVEIIRKFEKHLAYWVSERDQGHYDAINKGFAHATGEIMAWLNSDDKYTPWAFRVVAEIVTTLPQVQWLTSKFPLAWNRTGEAVVCTELPGFARDGFYRAGSPRAGSSRSRHSGRGRSGRPPARTLPQT
jgi:glycosyltransferase involved in cell wall biosynthesis